MIVVEYKVDYVSAGDLLGCIFFTIPLIMDGFGFGLWSSLPK